MYALSFRLRAFEEHDERARETVLRLLLEALVAHNVAYLSEHPETPLLYESGVRYELDDPDREQWKDIAEVLVRAAGDCKDLVAWRLAELRTAGEHGAVARIRFMIIYGRAFNHVTVRRADGRFEDPSLVLGTR